MGPARRPDFAQSSRDRRVAVTPAGQTPAMSTGARILAVDDEPDLVALLHHGLTKPFSPHDLLVRINRSFAAREAAPAG